MHILVNNAGINPVYGDLLEVEESAWDKVREKQREKHFEFLVGYQEKCSTRSKMPISNPNPMGSTEAEISILKPKCSRISQDIW